jgi:hypothetical protein
LDDPGIAIGVISISAQSNRTTGSLLEEDLPDRIMGSTNEIEINLNYAQLRASRTSCRTEWRKLADKITAITMLCQSGIGHLWRLVE